MLQQVNSSTIGSAHDPRSRYHKFLIKEKAASEVKLGQQNVINKIKETFVTVTQRI
jgi:hypothetical protein